MNKIKRAGYLWKCYGFTMTHMWGLHVVSGILAAAGIGMLIIALAGIGRFEEGMFYRLLAASAVVTLADIAMVLYSIFAILFYRFAEQSEWHEARLVESGRQGD